MKRLIIFSQIFLLLSAGSLSAQRPRSDLEKFHTNEGLGFLNDRRFKDALESFRKLLPLNELNAHYYTGVTFMEMGPGYEDKALEEFQKVIKIQPEHEEASRNMWKIYAEAERYDVAVEFFEELSNKHPNNVLARYFSSQALLHEKDFRRARTILLELVVALEQNNPKKYGLDQFYFDLREACLQLGGVDTGVDTAITVFERLHRRFAKSVPAKRALGQAYYAKASKILEKRKRTLESDTSFAGLNKEYNKYLSQAAALFKELTLLKHRDHNVFYQYAQILVEQDDYKNAIIALHEVRRRLPEQDKGHLMQACLELGKAYVNDNDHENAIRYLLTAEQLNWQYSSRRQPAIQFWLGRAYDLKAKANSNKEEAIEDQNRAELYFRLFNYAYSEDIDAETCEYLALIYWKKEQYQDVVRTCDNGLQAAKRAELPKGNFYFRKAEALSKSEKYQSAVGEYENALNSGVDSLICIVGLVQAYRLNDQVDKAIWWLEIAENKYPKDARIKAELGKAYIAKSDDQSVKEGIELLNNAKRMNGSAANDFEIQLELASAYRMSRDYELSEQLAKSVLSLVNKTPQAEEKALAVLGQLYLDKARAERQKMDFTDAEKYFIEAANNLERARKLNSRDTKYSDLIFASKQERGDIQGALKAEQERLKNRIIAGLAVTLVMSIAVFIYFWKFRIKVDGNIVDKWTLASRAFTITRETEEALRDLVRLDARNSYGDAWEDRLLEDLEAKKEGFTSDLRKQKKKHSSARDFLDITKFHEIAEIVFELKWDSFKDTFEGKQAVWKDQVDYIRKIRNTVAHERPEEATKNVLQKVRIFSSDILAKASQFSKNSPVHVLAS